MTTAQWESRYTCALGMSIYIHVTHDELVMTVIGIAASMLFASMPAIKEWDDRRKALKR